MCQISEVLALLSSFWRKLVPCIFNHKNICKSWLTVYLDASYCRICIYICHVFSDSTLKEKFVNIISFKLLSHFNQESFEFVRQYIKQTKERQTSQSSILSFVSCYLREPLWVPPKISRNKSDSEIDVRLHMFSITSVSKFCVIQTASSFSLLPLYNEFCNNF